MDVLLSFVGNRDPYREGSSEYGPVLSLLQERQYSKVFLFCTGPDYIERAKTVERIAAEEFGFRNFAFINLELESVIDYEEIYVRLESVLSDTLERAGYAGDGLSVLLDPGTPQMQTCWFLLVRSGRIQAKLLQGIPARFAGGIYKVKEVRLEADVLPEIMSSPRAPDTASAPMSLEFPMLDYDASASEPDQPTYRDSAWIKPPTPPSIVGESRGFKDTLTTAHRCAAYDVSVLVRGETGCGKGVVAKFIHDASPRRSKPFLPVNCASISASIAESELFGHVKGAYTGAETERLGKFRAADGGTIFLDEIGDLPKEIQPKLLRVLEDKTLTPLGGDDVITVDVRVIAATNRNLEELIDDGSFRRDLYERLAQTTVSVPPLRDRPDDIELLIDTFLDRWNRRYHEEKGLSEQTLKLLTEYPWPGNVRELENAICSLCAVGRSPAIGPSLLPPAILAHVENRETSAANSVKLPEDGMDIKAYLTTVERDLFVQALERADGNRSEAAKLLGLNAPAFRKALRERFDVGDDEGKGAIDTPRQ